MKKNEFMDLLRYYFRHSNKKDLREILDDCEERFIRGRHLGMNDDEISRELGSPRDIYRYYMGEEIDTAPHRQARRKRRQIFNYDDPSERHPEFSDNYNSPFYDADDYEQEEPEAHGTHREAPPLNMFERFLYTLLGRLCAFLGSIFLLLFLAAAVVTALISYFPNFMSLSPVPLPQVGSISTLFIAIFLLGLTIVTKYLASICSNALKRSKGRRK